jgi:hypothetical protein
MRNVGERISTICGLAKKASYSMVAACFLTSSIEKKLTKSGLFINITEYFKHHFLSDHIHKNVQEHFLK